jgi:hypothetical protein
MEHPDRVAELGVAARKRAQTVFDPASINRRWVDLYGSAISAVRRSE